MCHTVCILQARRCFAICFTETCAISTMVETVPFVAILCLRLSGCPAATLRAGDVRRRRASQHLILGLLAGAYGTSTQSTPVQACAQPLMEASPVPAQVAGTAPRQTQLPAPHHPAAELPHAQRRSMPPIRALIWRPSRARRRSCCLRLCRRALAPPPRRCDAPCCVDCCWPTRDISNKSGSLRVFQLPAGK